MKKIIYILNDDKRIFTYTRIAGLSKAIRSDEEPVNLYIFRSAGFSEYDDAQNRGEYNIFRLPDFNDFDGIILDINNSYNTSENKYGKIAASYAINKASASGKPVISLASHNSDFYYLGINNHTAMTSMIKYIHEDLGLTDLWFVMGPVDNYENKIRRNALVSYCETHGIPCEDERFYSRNFSIECGISGFESIYSANSGHLPQAVICASDKIAIGVCRAASKRGIKIPEDLMVTGFDNFDYSKYLTPSLTTVDQYSNNMGDECLKALKRIWKGEKVEKTIYTKTELVKRESTKETCDTEKDSISKLADFINKDIYREQLNDQIYSLQYKLPGCSSIEEMCKVLEKTLPNTPCRSFWLIIDRELYDYGNQIEFDQSTGRIKTNNNTLKPDGYPDTLELVFFWDRLNGSEYPHKHLDRLFPCFENKEKGNDYIFIPLHFIGTPVGYIVISDCVELLNNQIISLLVNTLTMAMRSFFDRKKLEFMNQMISGISMKDNLTGLCNRLGYLHLGIPLFQKTHSLGNNLLVLFIDMDKMKYINDTYGHSCGDESICCVSSSIQKNIKENGIAVRFGGDEFLVLTPLVELSEVDEIINTIKDNILETANNIKLPIVPEISIGYIITNPESDLSLKDYVDQADKLMYQQKKNKR